MSPIKELYKGKCLEDLSKHYTIPNLKNLKLKVLCNSAQKVYMEAEKSLREGDEEQSFIYFMKYFNVIDTIKKTPDYAREKQYISDLLGTNTKQMLAMDKAEKLSNSLKKRYSLLARQERALEKLNELEEYNRLRDKIDADIEMGKSKGNLSHQVSLTQKTSFTSQELFAMLKDAKIGVFIMDCRPRGDFVVSRLTCNNYINVPEEIILPGMSAGKIQQELDQNDRKLWASRGLQDHIVLMDWNSKGPEPTRNTPLWRLKDILENWDQDATYKSLLMLEGGYEDYILLYPMQCTNPGVKPPNSGSDDYDILDDIEYPSINDIVMKDDTLSQANLSGNRIQQVPGRPGIDRNSKAVALKTYEQKKQIQEILDEQEKLAEKSLINEKERLAAETNWEELRLQREMAAVEELRQNLLAREQEVMYNMLQLENKHRDYVQENDQLREELEEYKRREKELTRQGEIISEREAKLLEEAAAQRIREKEEEMRHIDEQREKLTQEREKKLAFAREQKSHLKESQ